MFPIQITGLNDTIFLELRTRRIITYANAINCSKRADKIYVKDIDDYYWAFSLPSNFTRLPKHHLTYHRMHLILPKLAEFNRKLQHTGPVRQNRISLLDFLSDNMAAIHQLSNFQTTENGDLISGIIDVVGKSLTTIEDAGIEIIDTVTKDVDKTIDTVTNASTAIVTTLSEDFNKFIDSVGIPNIVFFIVNILTILYVWYLRRMLISALRTQTTRQLQPILNSPPEIPRHLKPDG